MRGRTWLSLSCCLAPLTPDSSCASRILLFGRKARVPNVREYEETHLAEQQRFAKERRDLAGQVRLWAAICDS